MTAHYSRRISAAAMAVATLVVATAAPAAIVVQDTFTDGGRTNGADAFDIPWLQATAGTLSVATDSGGIGAGNALFFDSNATFQRFIGTFASPVVLNPGGALTVTFKYRFTTAPAATGGAFRFGLFNDGGTAQTGDVTSVGVRADDFGYVVSTDPGTTSGTGTSLNEEAAGASNGNDDILGGAAPSNLVSFGTAGASVNSGTTAHTATLTISRNSAGTSLSFTGQLDGGAAFSGTDATPSTFQFNEVAFGAGGVILDYAIDDVTVDAVPEPTAALAAATAAGLLALGRRRRASHN